MGRFALTNPLQLGQPIVNGQNVLSSNHSLTSASPTHTGIPVSSNLIAFSVSKFGTLTGDCTVDIEVSIDNGVNYRKTGYSFTNAELAISNGTVKALQIKGTHVRFLLLPGTMTGANGINARILD
jgi:hypothetical protein